MDKQREELVEKMVDRFLGWKLPEGFSPDAGISFKPEYNVEYMAKQGKPPCRHKPIGTNLFSAIEAKAMIEYLLYPAIEEYEKAAQAASQGEIERLNSNLVECRKTLEENTQKGIDAITVMQAKNEQLQTRIAELVEWIKGKHPKPLPKHDIFFIVDDDDFTDENIICYASSYAEICNAAKQIMAQNPESRLRIRGELNKGDYVDVVSRVVAAANSKCPICGVDYPHIHPELSSQDIAEFMEKRVERQKNIDAETLDIANKIEKANTKKWIAEDILSANQESTNQWKREIEDARRYRWLRNRFDNNWSGSYFAPLEGRGCFELKQGSELDSAIDKTMTADKRKGE